VFVTHEEFALNGHKENQTSYMIFIHSRVMAVFQMKLCVMRRNGKLRAVFLALDLLVWNSRRCSFLFVLWRR